MQALSLPARRYVSNWDDRTYIAVATRINLSWRLATAKTVAKSNCLQVAIGHSAVEICQMLEELTLDLVLKSFLIGGKVCSWIRYIATTSFSPSCGND